MDLFDVLLLVSVAAYAVIALLHDVFGYRTFVLKLPNAVFGPPEVSKDSPRQRLLIGVFFVTSLAWWQALALTVLMVVYRPDFAPWGALAGIVFNVPQAVMVARNIGRNTVGAILVSNYILHVLALSLWGLHRAGVL